MPKKGITPVLIGVVAGILAVIGIASAIKPKTKVSITASSTSGPEPLEVSFTAIAEGGTEPYSYSWDFGDGDSSTLQNPSHIYQTNGIYTTKLMVTDAEGKTASKSIAIIVTEVEYSVAISNISVIKV